MIKHIQPGIGLTVTYYNNTTYPYVNTPNNTYFAGNSNPGDLRYNGINSSFEVWDGFKWAVIPATTSTVSLDGDTLATIAWAKTKRNEELTLEERAKSNPALADLISQHKELAEKIKTIEILTR